MLTHKTSSISRLRRSAVLLACCCFAHALYAQQPVEPTDPSPLDGETYFFLNQLSAMQMDLNGSSVADGDVILQNPSSFTTLSQRWSPGKLPDGNWKIANLLNGLCLDSVTVSGAISTVQNPCAIGATTQEWKFTYTSNGYNTVVNAASGDALDIAGSSLSAAAHLVQTSIPSSPTQSQQWLLRPVFYRGNDNAIQEKEEQERIAGAVPWWQDAGQAQDLLQIMKDHGFNLVRIRPTPVPPYQTYTLGPSTATPATCTGNGCYAELDAADLDLAKRAKQLGMSVELSLLFDGGSSTASPGAWQGFTVAQTTTAIYNYTRQEIEAYRAAGVMPDIVAIGNEVDTGFLGSLNGSPSGAANSTAFLNFAAYETAGMQAIADAAADTSLGAAIPPPIRCIHITPAWDLTSFFSEVNANKVPYDAICQSYYPIFHGPLTAAQAAASNPGSKPIEQTALTNAANSIGKPIFLIEIGEHYENGFDSNDPWYPATRAGQRQFVLDVESALKAIPNNLAMGIDYWDSAGTSIPNARGFTAADGLPDATFAWNGLTLFDNADTSGSTTLAAATYNAVLPALSAVGGKLDPTLAYKFVNAGDGRILETVAAATTSGASLDTGLNTGITSRNQQWQIASNGDGYFQIASLNSATPANVLDTNGLTTAGSPVLQIAASSGTTSQEWDVVTAGNGYFTIVNKSSGLVIGTAAGTSGAADTIQQQGPSSTNADWIVPAGSNQMWQIIPVHISAASVPVTATPDFSLAISPASATITNGSFTVSTVTVTPLNAFSASTFLACSGLPQFASCTFSPSSVTPTSAAAISTLSIATNVQVASTGDLAPRFGDHPLRFGTPLHGLQLADMLFSLLLWPALSGRKRNRLRVVASVFLAALAIQGVSGCGGSSSTATGSTSPKTPAGQYTITIAATSGTLSHSAAFQLTVQ
jgi:arabinogalactan endo-1,4-beta-galactosidase